MSDNAHFKGDATRIAELEDTIKEMKIHFSESLSRRDELRDKVLELEKQLAWANDSIETHRRALWHDIAVSYARCEDSKNPDGPAIWANKALAAFDKQFPRKESAT